MFQLLWDSVFQLLWDNVFQLLWDNVFQLLLLLLTIIVYCFFCRQLMFFCYGIGAFVSPMIAEPYLLNEDCSLVVAEQTNETTDLLPVVPGILFNNDSDVTEADSLQGARQLSGVSIAFWIMALMQVCVCVCVYVRVCALCELSYECLRA